MPEPSIEEFAEIAFKAFESSKGQNIVEDPFLPTVDVPDIPVDEEINPKFELKESKPRKVEPKKRHIDNQKIIEQHFALHTPEMTDEVKHELQLIQLRDYMDPKKFFKTKKHTKIPKQFELGTVINGAFDVDKVEKKKRGETMMDEVLKDTSFRRYARDKYIEIAGRGKRRRKNH